MTIFGSSNCVYAVSQRATSSGYALAGLRSAPPLIIQGATFSDHDIVLPVNCLNRKRFLYSFGKQFGDGALQGVAMLGMGNLNLVRMVDNLRTSSGNGQATLSTPLGGFRVFVTGFGMAPPDPEFNLQPFTVLFKIAS
jgi:hypothetical protein